jgi:lysophospholipase L1-like esterase
MKLSLPSFDSSQLARPAIARWLAAVWVILGLFPGGKARAADYDLTPSQEARLRKFLPHTYPKLARRQPVKVETIGDSVMDMTVYDGNAGNVLEGYAGRFVGELGDQFYYTGGVRRVDARRGLPARSSDAAVGPEIALISGARGGKLMIHGIQGLSSSLERGDQPDLILVSFGINDANSGLDLMAYRRALKELVALSHQKHVDVMLFGPTLIFPEPPERGLALTPPYSSVMKEVAAEENVFFCDLGDLAWLLGSQGRRGKPPSFDQVAGGVGKLFLHSGVSDIIHPNTMTHRVLARRIYAELLNGPKPAPWVWENPTLEFAGGDRAKLRFSLENVSEGILPLRIMPLAGRIWAPGPDQPEISIKPGGRSEVTLDFHRVEPPHSFPATEPAFRMPVLLAGPSMSRIEVLPALMSPVAVEWKTATRFNEKDTTAIEGSIINTTKAPLIGSWSAEVMDVKAGEALELKPGESKPFKIPVPLPTGASAETRRNGPMKLTIQAGGTAVSFDRDVELVRNFGLQKVVPMIAPKTAMGAEHRRFEFHAEADAKAIRFIWDLHGARLLESSAGGDAFSAELNLDARSYGKRLGPGVTDALRVTGGNADGEVAVAGLRPWNFGTGYTKDYDIRSPRASLSTGPGDTRRITLVLPRELFYLHEWALNNGNSELGVQTTLRLRLPPDDSNPGGAFEVHSLVSNGLHRDDAESLAVLELASPSTGRWTVRLY